MPLIYMRDKVGYSIRAPNKQDIGYGACVQV